jgi:hypothetical protein
MLDIYQLADSEEMPECPDEMQYIGSITLKQAEMLKCVWDLCSEKGISFSYYDDSRLQSSQVGIMLDCCQRCSEMNADADSLVRETYTMFINLLDRAIQNESGIAAFCD